MTDREEELEERELPEEREDDRLEPLLGGSTMTELEERELPEL
jgi:hypothetical protein